MSQILAFPFYFSIPMHPSKTIEEYSDEELIKEHANNSNQKVFALLLRRYYQKVYRYCYSFFRDEELSIEATQDVFLSVSKSLHSFEHKAKFSTWLYRITKNHCLNTKAYYERRQRKFHEPLEGKNPNITREIPANQSSSEERLIQDEEHQRLYQAIDQLSEEHRTVILLRDIQEFSYDEIAQMTGEHVGTIKSRLFRARKHLQQLLS